MAVISSYLNCKIACKSEEPQNISTVLSTESTDKQALPANTMCSCLLRSNVPRSSGLGAFCRLPPEFAQRIERAQGNSSSCLRLRPTICNVFSYSHTTFLLQTLKEQTEMKTEADFWRRRMCDSRFQTTSWCLSSVTTTCLKCWQSGDWTHVTHAASCFNHKEQCGAGLLYCSSHANQCCNRLPWSIQAPTSD